MKIEPFKKTTPPQTRNNSGKLGQPFKLNRLTVQIEWVNRSNLTPPPISYLIYILIINTKGLDKWRN